MRVSMVLLLCYSAVAKAEGEEAVLQLSIAPLEGSRVQDGQLLGRGRVMCAKEHNTFHVWMAPEYLAPDLQSYLLYLTDNNQAKLHIRLQGQGWQQAIPPNQGINRTGSESSTTFDIISHGDQLLSPGVYSLRLSAACIQSIS